MQTIRLHFKWGVFTNQNFLSLCFTIHVNFVFYPLFMYFIIKETMKLHTLFFLEGSGASRAREIRLWISSGDSAEEIDC